MGFEMVELEVEEKECLLGCLARSDTGYLKCPALAHRRIVVILFEL